MHDNQALQNAGCLSSCFKRTFLPAANIIYKESMVTCWPFNWHVQTTATINVPLGIHWLALFLSKLKWIYSLLPAMVEVIFLSTKPKEKYLNYKGCMKGFDILRDWQFKIHFNCQRQNLKQKRIQEIALHDYFF